MPLFLACYNCELSIEHQAYVFIFHNDVVQLRWVFRTAGYSISYVEVREKMVQIQLIILFIQITAKWIDNVCNKFENISLNINICHTLRTHVLKSYQFFFFRGRNNVLFKILYHFHCWLNVLQASLKSMHVFSLLGDTWDFSKYDSHRIQLSNGNRCFSVS